MSAMSASNAGLGAGDDEMQFDLLRLTPALRQSIYAHVFTGSHMAFAPADRRDITKPVYKGQSDAFIKTDHRHLLVTCRQVYKEARSIYCAHTIYPLRSRLFGVLHGRYVFHQLPLRNIARQESMKQHLMQDHVPDALSNFTKAHVWHLDNITWQSSRARENHATAENEVALSQFARVKTISCSFSKKWALLDEFEEATASDETLLETLGVGARSLLIDDFMSSCAFSPARQFMLLESFKIRNGCTGCMRHTDDAHEVRV